jgi:hypothetical protein
MSAEPAFLEALTRTILPRVLPAGWQYNHQAFNCCDQVYAGLRVIVSAMRYGDGRNWIHFSMSRRDGKLPSWEDLRAAKDIFIGKDKKAIQVLPPEDQYVNQNPGVLHLFCCLSEDVLPDFRVMGTL